QVPDGRGGEPLADDPLRSDARAPLPAPAARAHRAGRGGPDLHHHAPNAARVGGRGVQPLRRQRRRLHEGGARGVAGSTARYAGGVRTFLFASLLLAPASALAQEPIVLEADVPADAPPYFEVPFEVPAGIVEIEVRHDDLSEANILDWGLR